MSLINEENLKHYIQDKILEYQVQSRKSRVDKVEETRRTLIKVMKRLPLSLRQRGWLLMEVLDKNRLMLSPKGEFIPKGQVDPIPGSDIYDLIKYSLRKRATGNPPIGFKNFIRQVKKYDMESGIISTDHFKRKRSSSREGKIGKKVDIDISLKSTADTATSQ